MTDFTKDYLEFATTFNVPKSLTLAKELVDEEVNRELFVALSTYSKAPTLENKVAVADAIVDSIYVLNQLAYALDLPLDKCWAEVHKSNMAKSVNGLVNRRTDGKILKPAGWQPPDLWTILHDDESAKEYSKNEYAGLKIK